MTPQQAIDHYKTARALAKALDISPAAVSAWLSDGHIPTVRQYQIQVLTKNKLKAGAQ